jgi:hypothetical protein
MPHSTSGVERRVSRAEWRIGALRLVFDTAAVRAFGEFGLPTEGVLA